MYQRKTRRRLFYTSGLISLVLLPLMCVWLIDYKYSPVQLYVMEIVMPDPSIVIDDHVIEIRTFNNPDYEITLDGDLQNDNIKLDSVKLILNEVKNTDSSDFLLQVNLAENTKYWELIKLFDICNILSLNRYALFGNEFRVYYSQGEQKIEPELMLPVPQLIEIKLENSLIKMFRTEKLKIYFFLQNIKFIWPSAIFFLIMLISTIWRFIKY